MSEKKQANGFEENFRKLESLAQELQQNRIAIDELIPKMKDALSSVKICKEVLKKTKSQLTELQSEFESLERE